ncbi:MAG: RnfABCDGE type electron transport complex subunit G [candidate division WOR-3 bacterium]
MKKEYQMVIVLTAIIGFAGGVLAYTYTSTKKDIEKNADEAKKRALAKVVSGSESYEEVKIDDNTTIMLAKAQDGELLGYGVLLSGAGFQGPIKVMVGFNTDCSKVLGIEIIENSETPGLGNRIVEDWFKDQFKGKMLPLNVVKGKNPESDKEIQAITGATISSKSVVNIVNKAQEILKNYTSQGSKSGEVDENILTFSKNIFGNVLVKNKGEFYALTDSLGGVLGYAVISKVLGYEDTLAVLVITDGTLSRVLDLKVLRGSEYFTNEKNLSLLCEKIRGKTPPIKLKDVQALTGATITQDAIVSAVNQAFEILKKELN